MPPWLAFLLLLFIAINSTNAQPSPSSPDTNASLVFNKTASTVVTVLLSVFFFLLFLCLYLNQYRYVDQSVHRDGAAITGGSSPRRRGLDPAVIETFPIMIYKEIKEHHLGKGSLECAVCLTPFEDDELLKLLPTCSHVFHPDCIGPWLAGHATCPLCRANLAAPATTTPPQVVELPHESVTIAPPPVAREQSEITIVAREGEDEDEDDDATDAEVDEETRRREEAIELERLRSIRRAARKTITMRSHSTGHSLVAATAAAAAASASAVEEGDHERFTLQLPEQVRKEVMKARRLKHSNSSVVLTSSADEGSTRGGARSGIRWPSFMKRTMSWTTRRGDGDGSIRKGAEGSTRRGTSATSPIS